MDDLISRQVALRIPYDVWNRCDKNDIDKFRDMVMEELERLPSAKPEKTQLSGEDATFDCISRQDALDGLSKLRPRMIDTYEKDGDAFLKVRACDVNDMLEGLPSAHPDEIAIHLAYMRGKIDGIKECTEKLRKLREEFE